MLKKFPKILIIFFLTVFVLQLFCLFFLLAAPAASQAATDTFTPQIQISDYTFDASDKSTGNIARYVRAIYKYAIGIVGILAAVVLMIGGVMWIVAGGNSTAIGEAKSWIGASLTGLVIALCSYLILATVNPALVDLKTTTIQTVKQTETKSTLKENDPCVSSQEPYCSQGLECKDGKCAITDETKKQCEASSYTWNEPTNCNGATYSDYLCSCKGNKPNDTYKCCTSMPAPLPITLGGCCQAQIIPVSGLRYYSCFSSPNISSADCTSGSTIPNSTNRQFFSGNFHCDNSDNMCKPN